MGRMSAGLGAETLLDKRDRSAVRVSVAHITEWAVLYTYSEPASPPDDSAQSAI